MIDFIKQNPLKVAGAVASSAAAILSAIWAIDSHYASAADLQAVQQTLAQQIIQLRVNDLDDKIFMLVLKKNQQSGKLDPVDSAMFDRYSRQMQLLQEPALKK